MTGLTCETSPMRMVPLLLLLLVVGCSSAPTAEKTSAFVPEGADPFQGREYVRSLGLDDGRTLAVSFSSDGHTVQVAMGQNNAWSAAQTLLKITDRECGTASIGAARSSVAILLGCDKSFVEDQAPTNSIAVWTDDLKHWETHDLNGEAFGNPSVTANGRYALWPQSEGLLLWKDGTFAESDEDAAMPVGIDDRGSLFTAESMGTECAVLIKEEGGSTSVPITGLKDWQCEQATPAIPRSDRIEIWMDGFEKPTHVIERAASGWRVQR